MGIIALVIIGFLVWGFISDDFPSGVMNAVLWGMVLTLVLSFITWAMLHDDAEITETKLLYEHQLLEITNNGSLYYVSLDVGSNKDVYEVIYLDEDHILEYLELDEDKVELVETKSGKAVVRVYEQKLNYPLNYFYQIPLFLGNTRRHYEITVPEGTILHRFNINK